MLADLRDSGSLEQEADVVAFLYRDGYYNPECPEPDLTEFIIAKHRNGPTGTVKLRFQREFTLFLPYGDESHFRPRRPRLADLRVASALIYQVNFGPRLLDLDKSEPFYKSAQKGELAPGAISC